MNKIFWIYAGTVNSGEIGEGCIEDIMFLSNLKREVLSVASEELFSRGKSMGYATNTEL